MFGHGVPKGDKPIIGHALVGTFASVERHSQGPFHGQGQGARRVAFDQQGMRAPGAEGGRG
eukprot:4194241-Lingulodinium_polyedra.AAC.1